MDGIARPKPVRTGPVVTVVAPSDPPPSQTHERPAAGGGGGDDSVHGGAHWSCAIISPSNPVRVAARRVVSARAFDAAIDLCIVANCFSLAFRTTAASGADAPQCAYHSDPAADAVLRVLDVAFTTVFSTEMALKMLVLGVVGHPGAYLRDGWNLIDAFVVTVSILGLMPNLCVQTSPTLHDLP